MRLTQSEITLIKDTIKKYINDAKIYIFGSRLDDSKKGGDIDIFIITDKKVTLQIESKIKFFLEGELLKPIDLVFHRDFEREIEKEALKGIEI
ncbi:MAG: nucleotidyltransferase domain-containing protein [Nautilia sp.]|nr:MAG: nucleotidyltransferase domain-containing protein [Nautilia sp.]